MENSKEYPLIPMPDIRDEVRKIAVAWAEDNKYHWIGDKHKLASDIQNYADAYSSHLQAQVKELSGIIDSQKESFDALVKKYRELETMLAEAESNYEPYQNECLLLQAKVSVQDKRIAELEEALREIQAVNGLFWDSDVKRIKEIATNVLNK